MSKPVIIILGKLPPPFMGPSIATQIILNSSLNNHYKLVHLDTKAYDDLSELGEWSFKKIKRNLGIYRAMFRLLRLHRPAIVWIPVSQTTTGFVKDAVFIHLAHLMGSKVVIHLRGSNFRQWIHQASGLTQWFVKYTLKKCKGVIVLGQNLRAIFKEYFKPEHIYVVPNGANYSIPEVKKDSEKVRLVYLANLQSSKGIEDVLEAVTLIHKDLFTKYHLDVIGTWRKEATKLHCLNLVSSHQLNVTIHPPTTGTDKLTLLAGADIFIFPPREPEGHPWVIVEAMAASLPIISTDQGAITESVIHQKNGFIVPARNPQKIAAYLTELINNSELRQRMGQESRKHYLDSFTEEKMVSRLVATFEHVMKN